jgi:hypothetical protein
MKISFESVIALTMSLFATLSPLGSLAYAENVPPWVEIRDLQWAGSGCPSDSVAPRVTLSQKELRLVFYSLTASAGPDIPITEKRKNCSLILRLAVPHGWSFTIFSVDYRGFASLDDLVEGTQRSAYFFEGDFPSAVLQTTLLGPFDEYYKIYDTLSLADAVWSPCGEDRALNINTEVRVSNRENRWGSGLIELNKTRLGFIWRHC